jgi:hypothetical protein
LLRHWITSTYKTVILRYWLRVALHNSKVQVPYPEGKIVIVFRNILEASSISVYLPFAKHVPLQTLHARHLIFKGAKQNACKEDKVEKNELKRGG